MVKMNDHQQGGRDGPPASIQSPPSLNSDSSFIILDHSPSHDASGAFLNPPSSNGTMLSPPHMSIVGPPSGNSDFPSASFVGLSLTSDLNPEDVQKRLQDVLQENIELKETLHQNNLAMKQQFTTLMMWQEEVAKVHQNHKQKFVETRDLIVKLKAENAQLKAENAMLKEQFGTTSQTESGASINQDILKQVTSYKQKETELTETVGHLNRQLETAERARRQLSTDCEKYSAQRGRLERDLTALKAELDSVLIRLATAEKEKQELQGKLDEANKQVEDLHGFVLVPQQQQNSSEANDKGGESHVQDHEGSESGSGNLTVVQGEEMKKLLGVLVQEREQVSALTKDLDEERIKSRKAMMALQQVQQQLQQVLQKQQQQQQQQLESNPAVQQEGVQFVRELKNYEDKVRLITTCLDRQTEKFARLDSWLQVVSERLNQYDPRSCGADPRMAESLKQDIAAFRQLLSDEQRQGLDKRKSLQDTQDQFANLFGNYVVLLKQWESFHEEQKNKDQQNDVYHEIQARGLKEQIDNVTAKLVHTEEALADKSEEINEMREKMHKLEAENEAIPILKAQVDVYQSDFNAEREGRERLVQQKGQLEEEVRHLQRRVQQMTDELDVYQRNSFDQMQRESNSQGYPAYPPPASHDVESSPSRDRQSSPPQESGNSSQFFYCPKCEMAYRNIQALENHVDRCLDLYSYP